MGLADSYPEHSQHTGYAHVALTSAEKVEEALTAFRRLDVQGRPLKAERAMDTRKLLPPYWFDTVGYAEGGEAWLAERAALEAERLRKHELQLRHNKSRRRRKREAHVEDLRCVLQPLRNPFSGIPLCGASPHDPIVPPSLNFSSCSSPFATSARRAGNGARAFSGLDTVNSWAAIWAEVPPACDPARGGQLCRKSAKNPNSPPTEVC
uniref:Uncharacterized protein n=1 Tax=Tetraselmis chuii TaxID=63592 RepID=A0A7S1TA72_9CHLO